MPHYFRNFTKLLRKNSPIQNPNFDAKLILEDGSQFPVHRVILAANSEFFQGLFTHEWNHEYWIGGVPKKAMKLILDHFYCQELSHQLTEEEHLDLIIWADYFAAPAILKTCMDFLLRKGFSSQLLEFSRQHHLRSLEERLLRLRQVLPE